MKWLDYRAKAMDPLCVCAAPKKTRIGLQTAVTAVASFVSHCTFLPLAHSFARSLSCSPTRQRTNVRSLINENKTRKFFLFYYQSSKIATLTLYCYYLPEGQPTYSTLRLTKPYG